MTTSLWVSGTALKYIHAGVIRSDTGTTYSTGHYGSEGAFFVTGSNIYYVDQYGTMRYLYNEILQSESLYPNGTFWGGTYITFVAGGYRRLWRKDEYSDHSDTHTDHIDDHTDEYSDSAYNDGDNTA